MRGARRVYYAPDDVLGFGLLPAVSIASVIVVPCITVAMESTLRTPPPTVRFDDPATGRPVALTVAVLRPELSRIVVQTEDVPLPGGEGDVSRAWTHAAQGRES